MKWVSDITGFLTKPMGFVFAPLLSDFLIFGLGIVFVAWYYLAQKKEYWQVAFKRIFNSKMALISFIVLCCFVIVGLLDSIHYRPINEQQQRLPIKSSLDLMVESTLMLSQEKTHSEPFATKSFQKEFKTINGVRARFYPNLIHAGKHLRIGQSKGLNIFMQFLKALGISILVLGTLGYLFYYYFTQKKKYSKDKFLISFITLGLIFLIVAFVFIVSKYYHVLGTDKTGGSVLYNSIKSIRTGLLIGSLTTLVVIPFAIFFGVIAAYFGGWVDDLVQYVYTTLSSIPSILLIAAVMLILKAKDHLTQQEVIFTADKQIVYLCIIMGLTSWTSLCRLVRGEVLRLRNKEYVVAAQAFGVSKWVIIVKHLVPNVMHIVLITMVLRFSGLVLTEAVLAYVGIGVHSSTMSWGNMINQARLELARDPIVWWNVTSAFIFMFALVLPANLFSDAVRDALDPKLRGERS